MLARGSKLLEYWLRSFSPRLASISLDVAVGGDVVQDLAQVIYVVTKNHHSTKPRVILIFSTPGLFQVLPPTVDDSPILLYGVLHFWEEVVGGEGVPKKPPSV